jgi:hypothetical protein
VFAGLSLLTYMGFAICRLCATQLCECLTDRFCCATMIKCAQYAAPPLRLLVIERSAAYTCGFFLTQFLSHAASGHVLTGEAAPVPNGFHMHLGARPVSSAGIVPYASCECEPTPALTSCGADSTAERAMGKWGMRWTAPHPTSVRTELSDTSFCWFVSDACACVRLAAGDMVFAIEQRANTSYHQVLRLDERYVVCSDRFCVLSSSIDLVDASCVI